MRCRRCVVTGWRGGAPPPPRPFPGGPQPDQQDVLRKLETHVGRDEPCQQLGQRLRAVPQVGFLVVPARYTAAIGGPADIQMPT